MGGKLYLLLSDAKRPYLRYCVRMRQWLISSAVWLLVSSPGFGQELDALPSAPPPGTIDLRAFRLDEHVDHPNDRQVYVPQAVSVLDAPEGQTLQIDINRIYPIPVTTQMGNGVMVERTVEFTSGRVIYPIHFRYGRIDVLAKLPLGPGLHPCIWLLRSDDTWPPEIDIAEVIGQTSARTHTVRTNFITGNFENANYEHDKDVPITTDFQIFSLIAEPGKLTWLIDGQIVRTAKVPPYYLGNHFDLVISGAVGEAWAGEFGSPDTLQQARIEIGRISVTPD